MLAALAATASAFVAPSVQAPRLAPAKALVEEGAFVPDMERRNIMNLILVFGGALPVRLTPPRSPGARLGSGS